MNERIKEIAIQAGLQNTLGCFWQSSDDAIERFAELVRQDEREAIAALVEADGRVHEKAPDAVWAKTVAKLIRARA